MAKAPRERGFLRSPTGARGSLVVPGAAHEERDDVTVTTGALVAAGSVERR